MNPILYVFKSLILGATEFCIWLLLILGFFHLINHDHIFKEDRVVVEHIGGAEYSDDDIFTPYGYIEMYRKSGIITADEAQKLHDNRHSVEVQRTDTSFKNWCFLLFAVGFIMTIENVIHGCSMDSRSRTWSYLFITLIVNCVMFIGNFITKCMAKFVKMEDA